MRDFPKTDSKIKYILTLVIFSLTVGCGETGESVHPYSPDQIEIKPEKVLKAGLNEEIAVTPPPFSDGIFPCTDCHKTRKPNPTKRVLTEWHDDISEMFNHDSQNRWCIDCHDLKNRDSLKLASGKLLDFKESYKLCGQCHGDKLRDWKVGVHGKRTGEWNGKKQYFLCVSCHNPHSPKFKQLKPEPPPVRLDETNK